MTALTLNTVAGSTSTYSGNIVEGATGMTLTKTGTGTQFFNGAQSYTGLTTVSQGTLAGNGSFTGAVSLASNSSIALSPGATAGAIGTLTISDASASALTLNGNRLNFDVVGAGTSDKIAITGDLVLNGTNTVLPTLPGAGIAASTNIDLMTYANKTGSGSLVFANGLTTMGDLTLVANGTTNAQLQVGAGGLNHSVWSGATGVWDGGANNWTRNGVATQAYVDGDFVTFNDSGTTLTVTSAGTVSPAMVTFSNTTAKAYVINATIGGTGTPVVISGGGSATLGGTNTYTGGTVLNAGTLVTTADGNLGTGGGITVNGTATWNAGVAVALIYNRSITINEGSSLTVSSGNAAKTVTGILSGNGALTFASSTDLIFNNNANTFTGAITGPTAGSNSYGLTFASIGDTSGAGLITLTGGSGTFRWTSASGSTTTLANRQFAISGAGAGMITALGTTASEQPSHQQETCSSTGAAGARTRTLNGTNTGINTFAGNIADGSGSVVGLTRSTELGLARQQHVFRHDSRQRRQHHGRQPAHLPGPAGSPANTTLEIRDSSSSQGRLVFLDDNGGTSNGTISSQSTIPITFRSSQSSAAGSTNIFVGNNNTTNGGSSAGTATGNTIALGGYISSPQNFGSTGDNVNILGAADGYRLQFASLAFPNLTTKAAASTFTITLNPTTAL